MLNPLQHRYDFEAGTGSFVATVTPPHTFWRVLKITLANPAGSGADAQINIRKYDESGDSFVVVPEGGCITLEPGGAYGATQVNFSGPATIRWVIEFLVPMTVVATAT